MVIRVFDHLSIFSVLRMFACKRDLVPACAPGSGPVLLELELRSAAQQLSPHAQMLWGNTYSATAQLYPVNLPSTGCEALIPNLTL